MVLSEFFSVGKKAILSEKKVRLAKKKSFLQKKSPNGRNKALLWWEKVLLAEEKYHLWNYSIYNEKAVRGPQPKQGRETYSDYQKKEPMKELNEEVGNVVFAEQQKFSVKRLVLQDSPLSSPL